MEIIIYCWAKFCVQPEEFVSLVYLAHLCSFVFSLKVQPFAASLSLYLPELWQTSGDHNMLRCAIVSTMTHLVEV